ncbi:LolA family protein [Niabella aquatica]
MKKLLFTGIGLLIAAFTFAQQRDPRAKALLDEVSAKFKSYKTVSAGFAYEIRNAASKVLSKKAGTVQMKGNSYVINLGGNKIMSDGTTTWNYDPAAKEVTVNSSTASEGTITPQKLFTDFYNKDFMYAMEKDDKVGGREVNKVVLQPIDKSKPLARVYLAIDKATKNIVSATVIEKSGNRYVYNISNFKTNTAMADADFTFNKSKYPGVEVVDLR